MEAAVNVVQPYWLLNGGRYVRKCCGRYCRVNVYCAMRSIVTNDRSYICMNVSWYVELASEPLMVDKPTV